MICPKCKNPKSKVTDSRQHKKHLRRRRRCLACNSKFTTNEIIVSDQYRDISGTLIGINSAEYVDSFAVENKELKTRLQAIKDFVNNPL